MSLPDRRNSVRVSAPSRALSRYAEVSGDRSLRTAFRASSVIMESSTAAFGTWTYPKNARIVFMLFAYYFSGKAIFNRLNPVDPKFLLADFLVNIFLA